MTLADLTTEDAGRFWGKVDHNGPLPDHGVPHYAGLGACWMWVGRFDRHGYGKFTIGKHGYFGAHRAAYALAVGLIPRGMWVLHRCDNPGCVNPEHLWTGTAKDNADDMLAKGRHARIHGNEHWVRATAAGRAKWKAIVSRPKKLTAEKVLEIRRLAVPGKVGAGSLSRRFGVSESTTKRIIRRDIWKHVKEPEEVAA